MPKTVITRLAILLGFALLLINARAAADPIMISNATTARISLAQQISFFKETSANMSIESVIQQRDSAWQKHTQGVFNAGFTADVYWFRLSLQSASQQTGNWILSTDNPQLSHYSVYLTQHGQVFKTHHNGLAVAHKQRYWQHRYLLTPIELLPSQQIDIYIRVESYDTLQLPLTLWPVDAFIVADSISLIFISLCFGIATAIILLSLVVAILTREAIYGYYVFYLLMAITFQLLQQGLMYQVIPLSYGEVAPRLIMINAVGSTYAIFQFSSYLLELKKNLPTCYRVTFVVKAICVLTVPLIVFSPIHSIMMSIVLGGTILMLLMAAIGIAAWYRRVPLAAYFVIAWSAMLIGIAIYASNKLGVLPRNLITENAYLIAWSFEVILLTVMLSVRINNERKEKLIAFESALAMSQHAQGLTSKNRELELQNFTDGLTGIKNRRYFDMCLVSEWQKSRESRNALSLVMIDIDHFKKN